MPRLRNVQSGAVVSCSEETAARLGSEWEPIPQADDTAEAAEPVKARTTRTRKPE